MKYAFLVAWREYAESLKAKGFWIGIFTFPVMLFLSIQVPVLLEEKATPVRHYVLVDPAGNLGPVVEASLETAHHRNVLRALREYARKYSQEAAASQESEQFDPRNVETYLAAGGKDAFLKRLKLKPGPPEFHEPRHAFQTVKLPADIAPGSDLNTIAEQLKPYLRGARRIEAGGEWVELSAAILIPSGIENHIIRPAAGGDPPPGSTNAAGLVGNWIGTLDTPQGKLRVVFKFTQRAGGLAAKLDSLDQGSYDIPVDTVRFKANQLHVEARSIQGVYEGTLGHGNSRFEGLWTQGPASFPLDLERTTAAASTNDEPSSIQYWAVNASDTKLRDDIERTINSEIRRREYLARGLDSAAVRQVEHTFVPFTSLNPKKEKGKEAISRTDTIRQWAPSGFVYLLWVAIMVIVQMLLSNTIEEKSNRIIEVLLSSVTPGELMMGKLLGIAAVGLTMVCAWMCSLFGILTWKAGGASEISGRLLEALTTSNLVFLFAIYFILGYLLYAGVILSIGSVCNTLKEAQSYMGLLTMLMMVPLLTMTFIPKDPNGPLARVLSWIPIYTPFTMMNRAGADPPAVDLIGTFILLLGTTALVLWLSGKIFRIGILRTGQPPKILEMLRWATRKHH